MSGLGLVFYNLLLCVGYTNVLKIDLKCPENVLKSTLRLISFFIIQWIEFKFGNVIDISIYLKNIKNVRKSTASERTPHASHIAITPNAPLDAVNYHIKHIIPISLSNLHN